MNVDHKLRVVVILSRIHPGESPSSYVCQGNFRKFYYYDYYYILIIIMFNFAFSLLGNSSFPEVTFIKWLGVATRGDVETIKKLLLLLKLHQFKVLF